MTEENVDYSSLPLTTRLTHKVWKVRLGAYGEAQKIFATLDPETDSRTFSDYEPAREAILEGVLEKCLVSTRAGVKTKTLDLCLLLCEIDTPNPVIEKLLLGFDLKQPKAVLASVQIITEIIRNFGTKDVSIKPLIKSIVKPLTNKDVSIRGEGKTLSLELFRWVGPPLKQIVSNLDPVLFKELDSEFDKLPSQKPKPLRLLRSEIANEVADNNFQMDIEPSQNNEESIEESESPIDSWELFDPVEVLSKIPDDFNSKAVSTKWKERKESLEFLLTLLNSPRLAGGQYDELINILASRIADTNVLVAVLAANCIEKLSSGLRNGFSSYASLVSKPIIERLKEKKANVVLALNQALISVFQSSDCQIKDFIDAISHGISQKNPQVKSSSLKFFCECLKMTKVKPSKGQIKEYVALSKPLIDDSDPTVREASFEFLGTLMKLVGEKNLQPFIEGIDKTKEQKVKHFFELAVISLPAQPLAKTLTKNSRNGNGNNPSDLKKIPSTSVSKIESNKCVISHNIRDSEDISQDSDAKNAPKIPPALLKKLQASTKLAAEKKAARESNNVSKDLGTKIPLKKFPVSADRVSTDAIELDRDPLISQPNSSIVSTPNSATSLSSGSKFLNSKPAEDTPVYKFSNVSDLEEALAEYIPEKIVIMIKSKAWKERLEGMNQLKDRFVSSDQYIQSLEPELVVRFLGKSPGWKESNFQVTSTVFSLIQWMAESCFKFNSGAASLSIPHLTEKIGDIKLRLPAINALFSFSERLGLRFVLLFMTESLSSQKSPKVLTECLGFIDQCILEFGTRGVSLRPLINFVTSVGLGSNNAQVRSKSVNLMGTLYRYIGKTINGLIGDINPQLNQLLETEFDKYSNGTPPVPTRSQPDSSSNSTNDKVGSKSSSTAVDSNDSDLLDELYPRIDVSGKFNSAFLKKLGDTNWKVRKEQLDLISSVIESSNKRILPTLSNDFFSGIKNRLSDSNKNLIVQTLEVLALLSESIGMEFEKYVKIVGLATMQCLADKKPNLRLAATKALDSYSLNNFKAFDQLIFISSTALQNDSPELRRDLLSWINKYFKKYTDLGSHPSEISPGIDSICTVMFSCLQDKSSEVRKNSLMVTKYIIDCIGFYELKDLCSNQLKGSSLQTVLGMIDQLQPKEPPRATRDDSSKKVMTAAELLGATKSKSHQQVQNQTLNIPSQQRPVKPTRPASSMNSREQNTRSVYSPQSLRSNSEKPTSSTSSQQAASIGGGLRRPMAIRKIGTSATSTRSNSPQPRATSQISNNQGSGGGGIGINKGRMSSLNTPPLIGGDERSKENRGRRDASAHISNKWVFNESPRPELISILNEQMTPFFSSELLGQLFSTGHYRDRDYLVGMTTLDELLFMKSEINRYQISEEIIRERVVSNSDLIFKYISIRLYDTQTNPIMKSIELAEHLIEFLEQSSIQLSDYESNIIIPHLISKLGDSKESIRFRVRSLITSKLPRLFPPSKIFMLLVETGLKNGRNSRTRQETLDTMTYLVDKRTGGLGLFSVCPDPSKVVHIVGNLIKDKDASVRTASLNCLVAFCTQLQGGVQELWALVGPLPEKERGMLEEKIRRSDLLSRGSLGKNLGKRSPMPSTLKRSSILPPSGRKTPISTQISQLKTPTSVRQRSRMASPSFSDSENLQFPEPLQAAPQILEPKPSAKDKFNLPNFFSQNNNFKNISYASPGVSKTGTILNRMGDTFENTQKLNNNSSNSFQSSFLISIDNLSSGLDNISDPLDKIIEALTSYVNNSRADEHAFIGQNINSLGSRISILIMESFRQSSNYSDNSRYIELLHTNLLKALHIITNDLTWAQKLDGVNLAIIFDNLVSSMSQLSPREGTYVRVLNSALTDIIRNCKSSVLIPLVLDLFTKSNIDPIKYPLLSTEDQNRKKYVDILLRCLWRIEKGFTNEVKQLLHQIESCPNPNTILSESGLDLIFFNIDIFFEKIPETEWAKRLMDDVYVFGDEPMRSVKSIMDSLITNLKDLSWLFIGDSREDLDLMLEKRFKEIEKFVADMANVSYVIKNIANYLKIAPNPDQWEYILTSMSNGSKNNGHSIEESEEIFSIDEKFKDSLLVSPRPKPKLMISSESPEQKSMASPSRTGYSFLELKKDPKKQEKIKSMLANSEIDDIIASYQNNTRRTPISDSISEYNAESTIANSSKMDEDYKDISLNFQSSGPQSSTSHHKFIDVDTNIISSHSNRNPISDIDMNKFPIGLSLSRSGVLKNSGSSASVLSTASSNSNNSESELFRQTGTSNLTLASQNLLNKPASITFDKRLKELKERLDEMRNRNRRFG
ncbi:Cytoskeleton-associated protein 5 [Smittium mucronatum]|uniref:Cytoskeleton-associated protein 5 n=1 Tax=Smittium mucronatum TaxID=133383 RepID=A0A1R0H6D6_9FUNG|nr:Cytoskeleton-associated protein 5 [Smittium mucronatum]